jgi:hypothetical protein
VRRGTRRRWAPTIAAAPWPACDIPVRVTRGATDDRVLNTDVPAAYQMFLERPRVSVQHPMMAGPPASGLHDFDRHRSTARARMMSVRRPWY